MAWFKAMALGFTYLLQSVGAELEKTEVPAIALPCAIQKIRSEIQQSPSIEKLIQASECISTQFGKEQLLLDSLHPWVPQAPGIWRQILNTSTQNPDLNPSHSRRALPWALSLLPEMNANDWRVFGEQSLMRGDTLSALVFWMRQIALDSMQKPYVEFRLKQFFQVPRIPEDEDKSSVTAITRHHEKKIQNWTRTLSIPATWQNFISLGSLELSLWETQKVDLALKVLQIRLKKMGQPNHFESWVKAAQALWNQGKATQALEALNQAQLGWVSSIKEKPTTQKQAKQNTIEMQCLNLALKISQALEMPAKGAEWANRLIQLSQTQIHSPASARTEQESDASIALRASQACLAIADWNCMYQWGKGLTGTESESFQMVIALALVGQGKFSQAQKRLQESKDSQTRTLSNGVILNTQGWVEAYAGHWDSADSLWTLSSAYLEEPYLQSTLEMRRLLLLDTNALPLILRGQFNSPFPIEIKRQSLAQVPEKSKLWGDAQWILARLALSLGEAQAAQGILRKVAEDRENPKSIVAKAYLARLLENDHPGQAIAEFESLLVESQQGVPAEFARERLGQLGK